MKVVLINGAGGSGKDTVVKILKTYLYKDYDIINISTIDKIKVLAAELGWDYKKDEKGRQFLADLKTAWTKYNNGANNYVLDVIVRNYNDEQYSNKEMMYFVHCREPEAINWFVEKLNNRSIDVCTLFIERQGIEEFFNEADQNVKNFKYDITLLNNKDYGELEVLCKNLSIFLCNWDIKNKILV